MVVKVAPSLIICMVSALFSKEITARTVIKYTDPWDEGNIIQSENKQIPQIAENESFADTAAPALRLKVEEFVNKNGNLRQQEFVAQIWALIFGSHTSTTTVSQSGTTKTTPTVSTTIDPSTATLAGRTRRTTKYKIIGSAKIR